MTRACDACNGHNHSALHTAWHTNRVCIKDTKCCTRLGGLKHGDDYHHGNGDCRYDNEYSLHGNIVTEE